MPSPVVVSVVGVAVTYVVLRFVAYLGHDPKEPPLVTGTIPFITPLLGLAKEKANYYVQLKSVFGFLIQIMGLNRN